jgi:hypothetical protein
LLTADAWVCECSSLTCFSLLFSWSFLQQWCLHKAFHEIGYLDDQVNSVRLLVKKIYWIFSSPAHSPLGPTLAGRVVGINADTEAWSRFPIRTKNISLMKTILGHE